MTVAQILIDREDMDVGEFGEKHPEYPFGDAFATLRWLTKLAREEASALAELERAGDAVKMGVG
jgi:hypothetical protein